MYVSLSVLKLHIYIHIYITLLSLSLSLHIYICIYRNNIIRILPLSLLLSLSLPLSSFFFISFFNCNQKVTQMAPPLAPGFFLLREFFPAAVTPCCSGLGLGISWFSLFKAPLVVS